MSESTPFTVVVPTRQRADVLGPALMTIVMQDYDNLEILVSDNCSADHTRDVVESFQDPRIRYVNTGERLSMSHNWEFALSHVNDGWVTFVGDDDGLLPGTLGQVSDIAAEYRVSAIGSSGAAYQWPYAPEQAYGHLTVSTQSGCELRGSKDWLSRVMAGTAPYSALPILYTGGFIKKDIIDAARYQGGSFYRSMIPDVYSAVVMSKITDNYVFCKEPLAIGGSSRHSTGSSQFSGKKPEKDTGTPAGKFFSEPNIPFHADYLVTASSTPPPSIELLVYESFLQSSHVPAPGIHAPDAAGQLEVVLRRMKRRHREDLLEWGKAFAQQNGLDFESIAGTSRRLRLQDKVSKGVREIGKSFRVMDVHGDSRLPIRDVYEASIVAASVKKLGRLKLS